ncbi:Cthe_2314 family HEPN domain-containing protein [Dethiothermospora halolimnae]|uniref:Cthe_2314 family HEPN domain-containing protein n=1 Tax=Dethiothermospora halolimnae TaxID=3114390 RepID=UPI003CCBB7C9
MSNYDLYQHYLGIGMSFVIKKKMLDYELNDFDNEFCGIFYDSMFIYKSFETMRMICSLIEKIPSKDFFDEREILEDEYLKYHIENYLGCIFSMLDKLSKLLNGIYELGIKDFHCSFIKIIKYHLKSLPQDIQFILCDLNVKTKKLRKYRNHIVHKGEFNDEEWFMFSGLSFLSRKSDSGVPNEQLRREVNKEFERYYGYLVENNGVLSNSVMKILEVMAPIIKEKTETTINSWSKNEKEIVYKELEKRNNNFA